MRTLTGKDFSDVGRIETLRSIRAKMRNYMPLRVEIKSDFGGNLFYNLEGVTRPLNICIPELKNEHDKMKFDCKVWHCSKCGKQQTTKGIDSLSGVCRECQKEQEQDDE